MIFFGRNKITLENLELWAEVNISRKLNKIISDEKQALSLSDSPLS